MNISQLLDLNVKFINQYQRHNHSLVEVLCGLLRFDQKSNVSALVGYFQSTFGMFDEKNRCFVDWVNVVLFNVCAYNEELMIHCDNELLESTEDINKFSVKELKQYLTSSGSAKIKFKLKTWITKILSLPYFERILAPLSKDAVQKNKSLRSLLETIDYITLKYEISHRYAEKIKECLRNLPKMGLHERSNEIVEKMFNEGQKATQFIEEITNNYMINLQEAAQIISANYFHAHPPRKIFQKANTSGQILTEEIIDYLIRKINKNQLFSQKNEHFRPFELLMNVLVHRQASVLTEVYSLFSLIISNGRTSIYHLQNQKQIQRLSQMLSFEIPNNYPHLHRLIKYIFSSLLAKYSQTDSIELIKKFILNRFLLNPVYFALFSPLKKEEDVEKFVQAANQFRILFYQKKSLSVSQSQNNPKIIDFGQLLRKALDNMLRTKQIKVTKSLFINDKGIYINDCLLNNTLGNLFQTFKAEIKKNVFNQSNNSEISLSFSLKNDSMSKIHAPTQQVISSNNSFVPHIPNMPKPPSKIVQNTQKSQSVLKNVSQNMSTHEYLGQQQLQQSSPIDHLQHLILQRRQYGQLRRQIDQRCLTHSKKRQTWTRNLYLLNEPLLAKRKNLQKSLNQTIVNSIIF